MDETVKEPAVSLNTAGELVPFDQWLKSIGKSRATGWNMRKRGAIKAVNIFGSLYLSRKEIARFEERAHAGDFELIRKRANRPS